MKLATVRQGDSTVAAVVDQGGYLTIDGCADVGALLQHPDWSDIASTTANERLTDVDLAPVVTRPRRVVCTGLNYSSHILEMGRELPQFPTLFAKFASTLTGPFDRVPAPQWTEDERLDWEGELAVVVGRAGRRIAPHEAADHIAGFTIANDISMRSWQNRTNEWLQGKAWDATTPLGPALVTSDAFDYHAAELTTLVDDDVVQCHSLSDLLFGPEHLVSYISTFTELQPGDVILTGTPGGVGHARRPQQYLSPGDTVTVRITGLGEIRNVIEQSAEVVRADTQKRAVRGAAVTQ